MTNDEILTLIESDPTAKALADAGADNACAERLSVIAPKVVGGERRINGLDIVAAFADPAAGATAYAKLVAAAASSPVVKLAVDWMAPGAQGLNIADIRTLAMCDALTTAGVWTEAERDAVKGLAMAPQVVSTDEVSEALVSARMENHMIIGGGE